MMTTLFRAVCRMPGKQPRNQHRAMDVYATSAKAAAIAACEHYNWHSCSVARPGVYGRSGLYRLEVYTSKGRLIAVEGE